ncbi:hypothetical protein ACNKHL_13695 [Shigella flexneri]
MPFCETGRGVSGRTQQGRGGLSGRPDAPVNRGLNCIKGYFLPRSCTVRPFDAAAAAYEKR